jgi:hypothetical protein
MKSPCGDRVYFPISILERFGDEVQGCQAGMNWKAEYLEMPF